MRFSIVTPCFNGARFIDETIVSVVAQAGPFAIRYHIQDGGSTDGTLDKLARWQALLGGAFPILCRGVEFTYASVPDRGMYDAINTGFARCGESDAMAWINADDRFEAGAFHLVATLLSRFPDIDWLSGRPAYLDENGAIAGVLPLVPLPRKAVAAGLLDGRYSRFIQQEGAFWRPRLWQAAGGVGTAFRLAGDFDLWRRFARHADPVAVDSILGCFRRHGAQATGDMLPYYAEVDRSLTAAERQRRDETAALYASAAASVDALRAVGFAYRVVRRSDAGAWECAELAAADPAAALARRSLLGAVWQVRRQLSPRWSIRRLLRRLRRGL
jgi:glycosyltransferase involved in cell wall biosynthesis